MERTTGAKRNQMGNSQGARNTASKERNTANNKAVGLTDDMITELEKYDDLRGLIRLHDMNKQVR